jgi:hypothetical protein
MDGHRNRRKVESFGRRILFATLVAASATWSASTIQIAPAQAQQTVQAGQKPNILVIFGDDIGQTDVSAYSKGVMGYMTPNIDRIAGEGMIFTDYYAEQSCGPHLLQGKLRCGRVCPKLAFRAPTLAFVSRTSQSPRH